MKVVVNRCFGGFGLSEAAYLRLNYYGVPIRAYVEQLRNPSTGLYADEPLNNGVVIFDRLLSPKDQHTDGILRLSGRYWDAWTSEHRDDSLLVKVVEELGTKASGKFARLEVVEIPDDVEWKINDYDGNETIEEQHRSW